MSNQIKPSIRLYIFPTTISKLLQGMMKMVGAESIATLPSECIYYARNVGNIHHGLVKRGSRLWYSPVPGAEWSIDQSGTAVATLSVDEVVRLEAVQGKFLNREIDYVSEMISSHLLDAHIGTLELHGPIGEFLLQVEPAVTDACPPPCYIIGTEKASNLAWGIQKALKAKSALAKVYKAYPEFKLS